MNIQGFLSFDKMITPTIIRIIFIVGASLSILIGLIQIVTGLASNYGGGVQVFLGIITIVVGPLLTRIYCELLILFFKMQETLVEMKKELQSKGRD